MSAVAFEAMSPFGIMWGYLVLLLLPVLLMASVVLAVVRRRQITSPTLLLLLGAASAAGIWTFFTVGQSVSVPFAGDPQGSECVNNAWGQNPDFSVDWGSDCGRALAQHLFISSAPSLLMLTLVVAGIARAVRVRRGRLDTASAG
jgi:hypothetical protein